MQPEPRAQSAQGLPPAWWAGGLALTDRLPAPKGAHGDFAAARERLTSWRATPGSASALSARLGALGMDNSDLLRLLAEPHETLAIRSVRPAWAEFAEEVVAAGPPAPRPPLPRSSGAAANDASSLRPAVAGFLDLVVDRFDRDSGIFAETVDIPAIRAGVLDQLGRRLTRLAARTLVVELGAARTAGRLAGADSRARFLDFVTWAAGPGLADLLTRYPVLARLLAKASQQALDAVHELLTRFTADRDRIVEQLLAGHDPGPLTAIESGAGDTHQGGRSVAILRFATGAAVVYKPRSLALQDHFGTLVDWLNERVDGLALRSVRVLPMAGYGWLEVVEHQPCRALSDVDTFYRRQGALLALLYAVDGTDFHHENLIACADQPVLVDVETLFHPAIPPTPVTGPDPALRALTSSVGRTALLPTMLLGEHGALDISGFGAQRHGMFPTDAVCWQDQGTDRMRLIRGRAEFTGGTNRPTLAGHEIDPLAHEATLRAGFRAGYQAIAAHREELLAEDGPLARCVDAEIRIIARRTGSYLDLLDESTHPDLLHDGLDREWLFDLLWADAPDELRKQLAPAEIVDLWAGDVPMFTTTPASTDLVTAGGTRLPGILATSGLAEVRDKLARLREVDRREQDWLITATLASTQQPAGHRSGAPLPGPIPAAPPDPQRLLAMACELADELVAGAAHDDGRANWIGLELVEGRHWTVLPMGAGLAEGYGGVALFLAQLGALTGLDRYTELAAKAVSRLPRLFELIASDPAIAGEVGCGGFAGLGGLCYALARLAGLLGDGALLRWLRDAVPLVDLADDGRGTGLATGRAGGLAALLATHAETGLPEALRHAQRLADRVAANWDPAKVTQTGLLHGAAGIGLAMLRYAEVSGVPRYAEIGAAALAADRQQADRAAEASTEPVDLSWCSGLAGALLASVAAGGATEDWGRSAVAALGEHRALRDASLCHGELGVLEALVECAARGDEAAAAFRDHAGARLLGTLDQFGPRCGTPREVTTPGLLSGLAGIGYGLLRLGFADRVPSVLLLAPAGPSNRPFVTSARPQRPAILLSPLELFH